MKQITLTAAEIAEITGSDIKKIYNALSRIKIKLNEEKKTIDKWT